MDSLEEILTNLGQYRLEEGESQSEEARGGLPADPEMLGKSDKKTDKKVARSKSMRTPVSQTIANEAKSQRQSKSRDQSMSRDLSSPRDHDTALLMEELKTSLAQRKVAGKDVPGPLLPTDEWQSVLPQTPEWSSYLRKSGRILYYSSRDEHTTWKPPRKSVLSGRQDKARNRRSLIPVPIQPATSAVRSEKGKSPTAAAASGQTSATSTAAAVKGQTAATTGQSATSIGPSAATKGPSAGKPTTVSRAASSVRPRSLDYQIPLLPFAIKDGIVSWRTDGHKHWNTSFLVVKPGQLSLYKHPSHTVSELEVDLKELEVDWLCQKSSKKYRVVLSSKKHSLTLKLEDEPECRDWYLTILQAKKKDEPVSPDQSSSSLHLEDRERLDSPDRKGLFKSTNKKIGSGLRSSFRKKMAEPVELRKNENSLLDPAVKTKAAFRRSGVNREPSRRSQYLSRFLRRRPTHEDLKNCGIMKDNAVFGCPLEKQEMISHGESEVPLFLWRCINQLEAKEDSLRMEGLYRVPGDVVQVQKIRLEVDQNNWSTFERTKDVHILAGCLKLFFRELPDPLIPYNLHSPAHQAIQEQGSLQTIVGLLPRLHRDTLALVCRHLVRVAAQPDNKMGLDNLAMVFGQVLMWPDPDVPVNLALAAAISKNCQIVGSLLDHTPALFQTN